MSSNKYIPLLRPVLPANLWSNHHPFLRIEHSYPSSYIQHKVLYVGGFVACERCGVCNSQPRSRSQLPISVPCIPDPHGGMRPQKGQGQWKLKTSFQNLRRLKDGKPPYGYNRDWWPDGFEGNDVRQVHNLHPTSMEPDARLYTPEQV